MPRKPSARILVVLSLSTAAACHTNLPATAQGTAFICGALCGQVVVQVGATSSSSQGLRLSIESPSGDFPALAFYAALPGTALQAITYDATNGSGASTVVQEAATGGSQWVQTSGAGSVGSFSLTLTDAGGAVAVDGGTSWPSPQGVLSATLEPVGTLVDAGLAVIVSFPTDSSLMCDAGPQFLSCTQGIPTEP